MTTTNNLVCLIKGHTPSKITRRFEDIVYGQRMIGRDENHDRIYENILCEYCEQRIHIPDFMSIKLDPSPYKWVVYKGEKK